MITAQQVERYHVERYKRLRGGDWEWVTLGFVNAASAEEARKKGRQWMLANPLCIIRATPVGGEHR